MEVPPAGLGEDLEVCLHYAGALSQIAQAVATGGLSGIKATAVIGDLNTEAFRVGVR